MTEIPESVMEEARAVRVSFIGDGPALRPWPRLDEAIAEALLAAEKRGEERERERLANMLDPEVGLPSDRFLRVIHADVETRGRKNNKFAVTVHHRNIVLSAVAAAIRKGPDQ